MDVFAETVAAREYAPHKPAAYPYQVASLYTSFCDKCPVLKAETPEQVANRLFLCDVTAHTLHQGMTLPGIRTPARLRGT